MTAKQRQYTQNGAATNGVSKNGVSKNGTLPKKEKLWEPLVDGLKWSEKYSDSLEKFFEKIPDHISTFIASLAIFTFGSTLRGEWVVIVVAALRQASGLHHGRSNASTVVDVVRSFSWEELKLEHLGFFFVVAHAVSYSMYFLIGGFLHWYYYKNRRHLAHEWKIQPDKWMSPELERHEIITGAFSLFFPGNVSVFLASYIYSGNPCTVYFQFDEYGWWWFFLQFPVIFLYIDYTTYIMHRLYHTPFLYKHFHKLHHKYKQPTAFSVTAVHPVELIHIQLVSCVILFCVPVHWVPFYLVVMYNFYHGFLQHSGINFKSYWWQPWEPDAVFHDDHHLYFHCNFGFNMFFWDKIHGTMRKPNFEYTEETFHGSAEAAEKSNQKALKNK